MGDVICVGSVVVLNGGGPSMTVSGVYSHEIDGKAVPKTLDLLYANNDGNVLTYVGMKVECVTLINPEM